MPRQEGEGGAAAPRRGKNQQRISKKKANVMCNGAEGKDGQARE